MHARTISLPTISLPLVFLLIAGTNAIFLTVLTPPFQVHDEFQHFFRAYQLSEGDVWGTICRGHVGGQVPVSLVEFVRRTWGTLGVWTVPPLGTHPLISTWHELAQRLDPERKEFAEFLTPAYSPLIYLPQTLGVLLGREYGMAPLGLLYCGRLANALAAVLTITLALKLLPVGREAAFAIALLPMAQFEYASVAPDASIIASAFLLVAIQLRAARAGSYTNREVCTAAITAAIVCSTKILYVPLLFANVPAILRTQRAGAFSLNTRLLKGDLAIAATAGALAFIWLSNAHISFPAPQGAIAEKLHNVFVHPAHFVGILSSDIFNHWWDYTLDSIGILGAWTIYLPLYVYAISIYGLFLAFSASNSPGYRLGIGWIFWNFTLIASVFILFETLMVYLFPSRLAGRYFLPLGALAAATSSSLFQQIPAFGSFRHKHLPIFIGSLFLLITILLDWTVVQGFGIL